MTNQRLIEEKLAQKDLDIQRLEARLMEARGYVRALRELLGVKDKSMVDQARDIILQRGHPVHITEMLRAMGREVTRENRVTVTGALAAYVRRGDIFTRPAPNQFGLIELKHGGQFPKRAPPEDFGQIAEPGEIARRLSEPKGDT